MRYSLPGDIVLRTENAAKPASQASRYLSSMIRALPRVETSVDYGCGKLRNLEPMLDTSERLTLVDSEVQLSRRQMVHGSMIDVRSWVAASNRVTALNTEEFAEQVGGYDRGYCINVLSAIPYAFARKNALQLLRRSLRQNAECLFVIQYRNSDFTRMASLPYAKRWQDGILLDSLRGYSFYALISPEKLTLLVKGAGFDVEEIFLNEGSVYLRARLRRGSQDERVTFDEANSFRRKIAYSTIR